MSCSLTLTLVTVRLKYNVDCEWDKMMYLDMSKLERGRTS